MIIRIAGTPAWAPLARIRGRESRDCLAATIRDIASDLPTGWPVGLEHDLLRREFGVLTLPVPPVRDPRGAAIRFLDRRSVSHLRRRPPSEIAARLVWDRLDCGPLNLADLLAAVEMLGGKPLLRSHPMRTTAFASGHMLEYADAAQVPARLARMLRRLNQPPANTDPLLHAIGVYFDTLLIHPLPDGNGRLARLLFQAALRQTLGLRAPILPLGPACARNRPLLIASYLKWEFDGDAQPLVDFIVAAMTALLDLYERRP